MSTIEEKEWLKKATKGDAAAFEQLVLKYQTQVYNLCFRVMGNAEDAADMTQETFLKAWRNLESFHGEASFSTWLYRLASNTCLDQLRSIRRRPVQSLTVTDTEGEEQTMDVPDSAPSPEDSLINKEERELLQKAMRALDPQERQILTLRVVNDLSYTEISEVLDLKEGTVKSRLARARDHLRKKLENFGNKTDSETSKKQKGGRGNEMR